MKKRVAFLIAVYLISASSFAQEKREIKHHDQMKHQHGMMLKQLNLTDAQKAIMKANHEAFRQKMQDLDKNESITVKEFRDKRAVLLKEQKAKMDGLLTLDQKNKMAQLKTEQKIKRDEHFTKHLDKMKSNLGLTVDQVAKLKAQRESMQSRLKAIKENEALTRLQKRDQLMALKTESKEMHKNIFTEEQRKKMEEMKKKHLERKPVR